MNQTVSKMMQKIAIAADHGGYQMKSVIIDHLTARGYAVQDLGTHSEDRVDYPDFGYALAEVITRGTADVGIGLCGSGIGMDIALNRYPAVRSALCTSVEMARLARAHNNANVLTLGARLTETQVALDCVDMFLKTAFEGGRHETRVEKLGCVG